MLHEGTRSSSIVFLALVSGVILIGSQAHAEKPIVTDEFDTFLVTNDTKVGDVLGGIELVFENPLKTTWSLVKPVPGGDRRNYLKEGQLDAPSECIRRGKKVYVSNIDLTYGPNEADSHHSISVFELP